MPTFHKILIITFLAVCVIAVLVSMIKSKKFFRSLFSSALQGLFSLFAVNALGAFTGITIAVNTYTLSACAIFGTPAVISALLLNTIFSLK